MVVVVVVIVIVKVVVMVMVVILLVLMVIVANVAVASSCNEHGGDFEHVDGCGDGDVDEDGYVGGIQGGLGKVECCSGYGECEDIGVGDDAWGCGEKGASDGRNDGGVGSGDGVFGGNSIIYCHHLNFC